MKLKLIHSLKIINPHTFEEQTTELFEVDGQYLMVGSSLKGVQLSFDF